VWIKQVKCPRKSALNPLRRIPASVAELALGAEARRDRASSAGYRESQSPYQDWQAPVGSGGAPMRPALGLEHQGSMGKPVLDAGSGARIARVRGGLGRTSVGRLDLLRRRVHRRTTLGNSAFPRGRLRRRGDHDP
jgi:hypothetical protein